MIRCFWQSKLTFIGGILLTMILEGMLAVRLLGGEWWIFILSLIMLGMIGTLVTILLSNLVAGVTTQKMLGILYVERKPQAFLDAYSHVPKSLKPGTMAHTTTIAYLADGLLAAGRPDEAIAMVKEIDDKNVLSFQLLVEDVLLRANLLKGDISALKQGIRRYDDKLARAEKENPKLAQNLTARKEALEEELHFLRGQTVNLDRVRRLAEESTVILRRLELMLLEGQVLLAQGQVEEGRTQLQNIVDAGGELALVNRAKILLEEL